MREVNLIPSHALLSLLKWHYCKHFQFLSIGSLETFLIPYPQVLAADIGPNSSTGSAESVPRILASPPEWLISISRHSQHSDSSHSARGYRNDKWTEPRSLLQLVGLGLLEAHPSSRSGTLSTASSNLPWSCSTPLAAPQAPITHPPSRLSPTLLGLHHGPAVDHHCYCSPCHNLPRLRKCH